MKKFDLNIEKILENWDAKHAIREIIANAIDEQKLTGSKDIEISKDIDSKWHIKDFGRGLKYEHFTQKENDEKLNSQGVIGKFGIGLKDALATFERKGVEVQIISKYGDISLGKSNKSGFDDLITLHAYISEPSQPDLIGTDIILSNVLDSEIEDAKRLFLRFSNERCIEKTKYGEVLLKNGDVGNIYINGVLVATEENFLLSYNITYINAAIRKAINRERTNVGRTAYTNSVKSILLDCESKEIANLLTSDLKNFSAGTVHDELKWLDVLQHAAKILNKYEKVVFVTSEEIEKGTDLVEEARQGNFQVVTIPENLRDKLVEQNRAEKGKQIDNPEHEVEVVRVFNQFVQERQENFEFKFVPEDELTEREYAVFSRVKELLESVGGKPDNVKEILVSETMERDDYSFRPAAGLWRPSHGQVIIKRDILSDYKSFAGVFLHEIAHARSGAVDATRAFETQLTNYLGEITFYYKKREADLNRINYALQKESRSHESIETIKGKYEKQLRQYEERVKKLELELEGSQGKEPKNESLWNKIKKW